MPVQRPERERWLALHLVLDHSRSMGIWHKLRAELRALFVRLGVFKNVRIWALDAENSAPKLRPLSQQGHAGVSNLRPSALVDPTGRTLVLVISDAVSPAWHAGAMAEAFAQWGRVGPTALLQVLPQHLWPRSSLGKGWQVTLFGAAGAPSTRLRMRTRGRSVRGRRLPLGVRVPIFALTPDSFHDWSRMVAGVPGASGVGYHLALPVTKGGDAVAQPDRLMTQADDAEVIKDFLRATSPTAIDLAKLLAVAPILSLPIIRTIQSQLMPASGQSHLAEIFLGGILQPLISDDDPEETIYTFVPGARELLLSHADHHDTRCAFKAVSSFIEEQVRSSSRFRAFLDVPAGADDSLAGTVQAAFAHATAAVLRDLGYHDLALAMVEAQRRTQRPWFARGHSLIIGVSGSLQMKLPNDHLTIIEAQTVAAVLTDPANPRYFTGAQTGNISVSDVSGRDQVDQQINQPAGGEAHVGVMVGSIGGYVQTGGLAIGAVHITVATTGPTLSDEERQLLARYLPAIQQKYCHLMLRNRVAPERTGNDERVVPELYLEEVYTTLTTDGPARIVVDAELTTAGLRKRLAALAEHPATPDQVEPQDVRTLVYRLLTRRTAAKGRGAPARDDLDGAAEAAWSRDPLPDDTPASARFQVRETRPELAVEALAPQALAPQARIVLLGGPGSGKSTVLRYVALLLAQSLAHDTPPRLPGWGAARIPFFIPLGTLNAQLDQTDAADALIAALMSELGGTGDLLPTAQVRHLLFGMLPRTILLLDGLDELSAEARPAQPTDPRSRVIAAIRQIARDYPDTVIVVTSRERSYRAPRVFPADEGWQTRVVQPFARGQVWGFLQRWYAAMARVGETGVSDAGAARAAADLGDQLDAQPALRQAIAATDHADGPQPPVSPLLLTMLAILHYSLGGERLLTERARIYEQLVVLLLHRWEPRHSDPFVKGRDLVSRLKDPHGTRDDELPDLKGVDDLRSMLHEVAFTTHRDAPDGESRGVIDGDRLFGTLKRFFWHTHRCEEAQATAKAQLFLAALKDEAGLLVPRDEQTYQFPHLTFQEYLAACHLAEHEEGEQEAYACWQGKDGDRWREVILLMMGCLRRQRNGVRVGRPWLTDWLLDTSRAKTPAQAQRDALLAADCYSDLGGRAALTRYSEGIEAALRTALAAILVPVVVPAGLAAADRVRAGVILGELGDPRPGVCDLPPPMVAIQGGSFVIGSSATEVDHANRVYRAIGGSDWATQEINDQPVVVSSFELARYPVTNAQFQQFIATGGYNPDASWWDVAGRAWLAREDQATTGLQPWQQRTTKRQPSSWDDPRFGIARPNHPVVGVNWYEATAFCTWLTAHLNDGYTYRLPSEAEWEYAARGSERRIYPWGDTEPDDDRANFDGQYNGTSAVGCFPAGATPGTGLCDMAGNIWEWTRSEYRNYPYDPTDGREDGAEPAQKQFTLLGGAWYNQPINLRAANRAYETAEYHIRVVGFRFLRYIRL
ncbi:SUMF1/EgtB/PvdO family nonheme iron enzyme [Chloroflexales bacterium ZM16-3]|nr:SUMF1/EgtB/PvdO family nonheme iron enzyme [Chloroflexales bacterium ZM16-3]